VPIAGAERPLAGEAPEKHAAALTAWLRIRARTGLGRRSRFVASSELLQRLAHAPSFVDYQIFSSPRAPFTPKNIKPK
jgi:hypothetical protein